MSVAGDLQLERDYWRNRCEKAEMETRVAMRTAMITEQDNDSLRVALAATRAELDGLLVRMANESRMTPLQKRLMGKERADPVVEST